MDQAGGLDLIIGTSTNGAVIYDLISGQTFVVSDATTPIPSNNILSHQIEGDKTYDGTDEGVYIADFANFPNSIPHDIYNTSNSQLPSNVIQAVAVKNGVQWYGTPDGLAKLEGNTWTIYNTGNSNLPSNDIVALDYSASGDALWIATGDGKLSKLDVPLSTGDDLKNPLPHFSIYPNPSSSIFNITGEEAESYSIATIEGKVLNKKDVMPGSHEFTIDLSGQPKGVYFIKITSKQGMQTQKVFVD